MNWSVPTWHMLYILILSLWQMQTIVLFIRVFHNCHSFFSVNRKWLPTLAKANTVRSLPSDPNTPFLSSASRRSSNVVTKWPNTAKSITLFCNVISEPPDLRSVWKNTKPNLSNFKGLLHTHIFLGFNLKHQF